MRLAICVVFLLGLFGVNAAESMKILNIETDGLKLDINGELFLQVDEVSSKASGLYLYDHADNTSKTYNVGGFPSGVTLKDMDDRRVIILQSTNFNPTAGGDFSLIYLHEGKVNKSKDIYHQIKLRIQKVSKDYRWIVLHNGREVEGLDMKIKKLLFKPIGIDRINIDYK